jgi:hypothetical protein
MSNRIWSVVVSMGVQRNMPRAGGLQQSGPVLGGRGRAAHPRSSEAGAELSPTWLAEWQRRTLGNRSRARRQYKQQQRRDGCR